MITIALTIWIGVAALGFGWYAYASEHGAVRDRDAVAAAFLWPLVVVFLLVALLPAVRRRR